MVSLSVKKTRTWSHLHLHVCRMYSGNCAPTKPVSMELLTYVASCTVDLRSILMNRPLCSGFPTSQTCSPHFIERCPEELSILREVVEIGYNKSSKIRGSCTIFRAPQRKTSYTAFPEAKVIGLMPVQQSCRAELPMISWLSIKNAKLETPILVSLS